MAISRQSGAPKNRPEVTWFDARSCWKKMIGGRIFYFQGTKNNYRDAANEAAAIGALWRQLKLQGHTVWPEGQPNRIAIQAVLGIGPTPDVHAARVVATSGGGLQDAAGVSMPATPSTRRVAVGGLTVEQAAKIHLADRTKARSLQGRTLVDYRQRLSKTVGILGKDKLITKIGSRDLAEFKAFISDPENMGRQYSKHLAQSLRILLLWASDHPQIRWLKPADFNDLTTIRDKPRTAEEKRAAERRFFDEEDSRFFTIEQIRKLYRGGDERMKAWILLGLNCAFTPDDICDLEIEHVKVKNGDVLENFRGKTGVARRYPLWPETLEAMNKCKARTQNVYWFEGPRGMPMNRGRSGAISIAKQYAILRKAVCPGAPDFRFLRHTSGNEIKKLAGAEISEVHLAHAEKHKLQGTYTAKLFAEQAKAVFAMRQTFESVWA